MSHDELTAGFFALLRRVETEEQYTNMLAEIMNTNAELLDHCQHRSAEVKAAVELMPVKHNEIIIGLQNNISEAVTGFDNKLRGELDQMLNVVDQKMKSQFEVLSALIAETNTKLDQTRAPAASSVAAPDLRAIEKMGEDIVKFRQQLESDVRKTSDELHSELNAASANLRDEASGAHASLRKEASDAHATLRAEASNAHAALRVELMAAIPVVLQSGQSNTSPPNNASNFNASADPFVQADPWRNGAGNIGGISGPGPIPNSAGPNAYDPSRDRSGRFMLYDEKVHISNKYTYDSKRPEVWLQDVRDYVAGRTRELDQLLLWIETQTDEIDHLNVEANYTGMCDCAPLEEVSRQLWSFLGPLVKENAEKASAFRNVPRHNGFEAWRRIAEPINDDKSAMRRELLPKVNNPRAAKSIDELEQCLEEWSTNCRLMLENGGKMPDDESRRVAFIEMLPADMSTYATMRMDEDDFSTFNKIKKWAIKYVKVQQLQRRKLKGKVNLVDLEQQLAASSWEPVGPEAESEEGVEESDWAQEQAELLENMRANGVNAETQVAVLAVMRGRFQRRPGFKPRAGGAPGGGSRRPGPPGNRPGAPPRGIQDLSCVNCGEKGHLAGSCPKPQIASAADRPCFICKKKGCRAATCPQRKNRRQVNALEDARRDPVTGRVLMVDYSRQVPVMCVDIPRPPVDEDGFALPRRPARAQLGHFIGKPAPSKTIKANRSGFRILQESDVCQCSDPACGSPDASEVVVNGVVADKTVVEPFVVDANSYPPLRDAKPVLKSKSKVIKIDKELEGWLSYCEGEEGAEAPTQAVSAQISSPASDAAEAAGSVLEQRVTRVAYEQTYTPFTSFGDWRAVADSNSNWIAEGQGLAEVFKVAGVGSDLCNSAAPPAHAVVSDSASVSGGCVGSSTLDQMPSEARIHAVPFEGKSDDGVSAVGEAIGPIGHADRDSCGSNTNVSNVVECTSGGVSGAQGCVSFGSVAEHEESDRIAKLVYALAEDSDAAKLSVLRAVAAIDGVTCESKVRAMLKGDGDVKLAPSPHIRSLLAAMDLGHVLAPVNLMEWGREPSQVLAAEQKWSDVEFEVALDSGSVVHIAAEGDTPCYLLDDSAKAKPCEEFIVGDGGTMRNLGQKTLNLSSELASFSSVFQIAAVHRPLMSVGKICDNNNEVLFTHDRAIVRGCDGKELCTFHRQPGGLYVAKLKLTSPFGRPER